MMEYFVYAAIAVTLVTVICGVILLHKTRWKNYEEAMNAPDYKITPIPGGRFGLVEKTLLPMPGGDIYLSWWPIFGSYDTREEAEKDVQHMLGKQ